MFRIIYAGKHGPSVTSDRPKIDAYKQLHYIQNILRLRYTLTCHEDGAYTVAGDGLEPLTFEPAAADKALTPAGA
jgi:hypothetical protein